MLREYALIWYLGTSLNFLTIFNFTFLIFNVYYSLKKVLAVMAEEKASSGKRGIAMAHMQAACRNSICKQLQRFEACVPCCSLLKLFIMVPGALITTP